MSNHPGIELLKGSVPALWFSGNIFGNDLAPFTEHPVGPLSYDSMQPFSFCYDKRAAYLAAASRVYLGSGKLEYFGIYDGKIEFNSKKPGIWHIKLGVPYGGDTPAMQLLESLLELDVSRETWQYTMMVEFLSLYFPIEIIRCFVFPERHQSLKRFYNTLKGWFDEIDRIAEHTGTERDNQTIAIWGFPESVSRETLKRLYVTTFGLLNRPPEYPIPGYIYQPDWWYSIVSQCNVAMLYHIMQAWEKDKILPVKVSTDALYYDKLVHLPVGEEIGQFHMERETREQELPGSWDRYYSYDDDEWYDEGETKE